MNLAVVKYNAGNLHSVRLALRRLEIDPLVTDNPEELRTADKVIFPGVGEASSAMAYLRERRLDKLLVSLRQPVLGICLGLQLMCEQTEENDTQGLGIFPVQVRRFPATDKVPHMGWNSLIRLKGRLFAGVQEESYVYFVHSYYAEQNNFSAATCVHSLTFSAAMEKDNFFALQFHPEKSAAVGEKILRNFLSL
jgi:glutamine amidotransferase